MAMCSVACADLGVGNGEEDFKNYFENVHMYYAGGKKKKSYKSFDFSDSLSSAYETDEEGNITDHFDVNDMVDAKSIGFQKFSYICFEVSDDYTLTVDEFAIFARTRSGEAVLDIDFFASGSIPIIEDDESGESEETDTGENIETGEEIDEDAFTFMDNFANAKFHISEEWSSIHLEFGTPQDVGKTAIYKYIIIRIKNNSSLPTQDGDEAGDVEFTFNYPIFRFTKVSQD